MNVKVGSLSRILTMAEHKMNSGADSAKNDCAWIKTFMAQAPSTPRSPWVGALAEQRRRRGRRYRY